MDVVLKISEDYITPVSQIINPPDVAFTDELLSTGQMNFRLSVDDSQVAFIKPYNKVQLFTIENGVDTLQWSGYIDRPKFDLENFVVECADEKRFMENKVIFEDKSYSSISVSDILSELVTEANTRSGGTRGNLSYETDLTDLITKEFSEGTDYYSIINTIAKELEAEWYVRNNKIILKQTIGTDRTVEPNFLEFVSNIGSMNESNIANITGTIDGSSVVTSLIGKAGAAKVTKTQNTSEFGHVERSNTFPEGDLSDQVDGFMNVRSASQREVSIEVNPDRVDFKNVNVGDLVKLRIERNNLLIDLEANVKVISRTVRFVDKKAQLDVKLGTVSKEVLTTENFLAELQRRVKALELQ